MEFASIRRVMCCVFIVFVFCTSYSEGLLKRCMKCRSRGDLGSCKDPLRLNATLLQHVRGVEAIPCASGWCGKLLEGGTSFKDDDYGIATERMCLQRGPDDGEDRCAYTTFQNRRVYMCFCQGDLCNGSTRPGGHLRGLTTNTILLAVVATALRAALT